MKNVLVTCFVLIVAACGGDNGGNKGDCTALGATWTIGAGPWPRVMSSRSGPRRQESRVISVVSRSSTMRRSASTSNSEVAGPSSRASLSSPRFLLAMVRRWPLE